MDISYGKEKLTECLYEMKPMLEKHWKEVEAFQEDIKFKPDYEKYYALDYADILHIYTARDEDELIGYAIYMVVPHLHHRDKLYANNDMIFIQEPYRKSLVGRDLVVYAEKDLKENVEVDVIMIAMKAHKPFQNLLEKQGYELLEYNYAKYVRGVK